MTAVASASPPESPTAVRASSSSPTTAVVGKSALDEDSLRSSRTANAQRYASVVPGGVRTRVGRDEHARDRALSNRAESLRRALSLSGDVHPDEHRTAEGTTFARLYEYASVLQEQAERCGDAHGECADASSASLRDELILRACDAYARAAAIEPGAHAVLYNWGIALGDRAERALRTNGEDEKARRLWDEAIDKYERAERSEEMARVSTQQATQGLNNLGLAYQSRAACVDYASRASSLEATQKAREERVKYLSSAVRKFRRAMRMDPGFDRATYNLGTAVYALSVEYASMARLYPQDETLAPLSRDYGIASALYVALALANTPSNSVYSSSFSIVKHLLPAPFILDETLEYAAEDAPSLRLDDFVTVRLVLDAKSLKTHPTEASTTKLPVDIPIDTIASIEPMEDLSLPSAFAYAVLHSVSANVSPRVFAARNPRVRDRLIDAVRAVVSLIARHRSSSLGVPCSIAIDAVGEDRNEVHEHPEPEPAPEQQPDEPPNHHHHYP